MAKVIAVASLGALLALAGVAWRNVPPPTGAIAATSSASLSIADIGLKVDAKSLPEQRIDDRTLVFVGPWA